MKGSLARRSALATALAALVALDALRTLAATNDGSTASDDGRPAIRVVRSSGVRADAAALLFGAPDAGSLRTALAAFQSPTQAAGAGRPVEFVLEIAGPDILAAEAPDPVVGGDGGRRRVQTVDVALYALSSEGALRASVSTQLEVDLDLALLDAGGLRWRTVLELPGGDLRLRALVRVGPSSNPAAHAAHASDAADAAASGALSLSTLVLSLPTDRDHAWLGSPRFGPAAGGDGWISVDSRSAASGPAPPARAVLTLDRPTTITPAAAGFTGKDGSDRSLPVVLQAWSLDSPERLLEWAVEWDDSGATVRPSGLAAGWARVRWRGDALAGPPLDVWLEPPPSRGAPEASLADAWPAHGDPGADRPNSPLIAGAASTADDPGNAAPSRTVRLSRARTSELRVGWHRAWTAWSAGDERAAEELLATSLQRELVGAGGRRAVDHEDLEGAFLTWLRDLGEGARPGWLSMIALHDRVYVWAIDRRQYLVATYARRVSWTIAAVLPVEVPAAKAPLAAYFTHFAGRALARYGDGGFASEALDAALALEPLRPSTRITRAIELERRGRSRQAVEVLRPLLEPSAPASPASGADFAADRSQRSEIELRFRLASVRAGLGSDAETNRDLERLSAEPGWVGALAAQERWRRAVAERRRDDAAIASGLEEARRTHPDDEKLALISAWHARRRDRDSAAEALTAAISPTPVSSIGPRRRLGERPGEGSDETLRRDAEAFAAAERSGRPQLAQALAESPRSMSPR